MSTTGKPGKAEASSTFTPTPRSEEFLARRGERRASGWAAIGLIVAALGFLLSFMAAAQGEHQDTAVVAASGQMMIGGGLTVAAVAWGISILSLLRGIRDELASRT